MNRSDLEPDINPPRTIKEIVEQEISYRTWTDKEGQERYYPAQDENINELLTKIYRHIESEAIKIYKSNEVWALKSYAYSHILGDATRQAVLEDDTLLSDLVSGLQEWQKTEFDPLRNFRRKLTLSGKKPGYIKECMRVATKIVTKFGKKERYTEAELLEFLDDERRRYCDSSYATRVHQLKIFLDSLPEDDYGRKQKMPIERLPSYPEEYNQPSFTNEEIDSLVYTAVMDEKPEVVLRMCIATVYGCRVGELAQMSSEHIDLDHNSPTIDIPTEKKGRRVPQPIPTDLLPLFQIPLRPKKAYLIQKDLKRICRKAHVPILRWSGIHSIRRSVVTALYSHTDLKEIPIRRFMRWSLGGRGLGVMPRYVKTPAEVTDSEVLSKHPFIPMWKTMVQFIPYLPQYDSVCNCAKIQ